MAPKRSSRLNDVPPPPSDDERDEEKRDSSDDDDEEQEEQEPNCQNSDSSEQEDDQSDEVSEDDQPTQKKAPVPKTSQHCESESSDVSDTDSEGTLNSPTASAFAVKPIVSKPMDISPNPKKPTPKSKPSVKRSAETEPNEDSRKKKGKVSNGEDGPVEEKKSAVTRLWSEDDEIGVLKGMIDYQSKKGADPYADMVAFHEFVKDSLHVDVSKNQLTDKIRRLKKKYQTNAEKGENGEDPVFSKPHEHKSFELSKKIWGGGGASVNGVDDAKVKGNKGKDRKDGKTVGKSVAKVKEEKKDVVMEEVIKEEVTKEIKEDVEEEMEIESKNFLSKYPFLSQSLEKASYPNDYKKFVKEMIYKIGSEKAIALEEEWKKVFIKECELEVKRSTLNYEQAKLLVAKFSDSDS